MGDLFNKHLKKATARTKEKLLEGIGRSKATQDEAFDFHAANLIKQAKACERLHKDLKVYADALKKLTEAEKNLHESIRQAYEPEWPDREHVVALSNTLDIQADELDKKVNEEIMASVTHYVSTFPELKKKVDKRGRKLVDYDSAKRDFNSLKASSKKGDADPKVTKAFTELQQAETLYKEINKELLEILPATYDGRITFLVDTLQGLFNSRSTHQTECAKLHKQLVSQLDVLGQSMDSLRVNRPDALSTTPQREESPTRSAESPVPQPSPQPQASPVPSVVSENQAPTPAKRTSVVEEKFESTLYPKLAGAPPPKDAIKEGDEDKKSNDSKKIDEGSRKGSGSRISTNPFDEDEDEEIIDAEKIDLPKEDTIDGRKILYSVQATHDYKAVDTDELSFAAGETIKVLESTPEDNLDDGWKMGANADMVTGVFPENFTKQV